MLNCYIKVCVFGLLKAQPYKSFLGKPLDLPPDSEEVAGFYGAMLGTEHAENATFRKNFFDDFKLVLKDYPPVRATCYATHAVDQLCHLFRGTAP